jgi:uncharacterized Zn finger protein (UPF0148 family)
MLKIYCSECGAPTTYTSNKPKFCSSCGISFNKEASKPQQQKIVPKVIPTKIESSFEEEDDDLGQEVNHVPEINKIDYEIEERTYRGEKLGNIVGTLDNSERSKSNKDQNKKITKTERKKFLEEFSKEAGALKPRTRTRKNAT